MPKPKKRNYHDYRESGRFARRPQKTISTPQGTRQSTAGVNPFRMSVEQQGWLAGTMPGWWISDHMEELRHFVSWIYVSVHKIAQQWAQAKVCIYDKSEEQDQADEFAKRFADRPDIVSLAKMCRSWRKKSFTPDVSEEQETPIPDHPVAKLLERPNPFVSGRSFRYQVACQLRLTGGYYIWKVPDQRGMPTHLWVIPRGWARPMAPTGTYQNGYFQITPIFNTFTMGVVSPSSSTYQVPYEQMIMGGYRSPLYPGEFQSPLSACSQIIDIMEQTDLATWSSFLNSVKPSMVFNLDPRNGTNITEAQLEQFTSDLEKFKAGANNAGKVLAMLGLTVQQMMSGPSELDYVNGRDQNRKNVFGIQGCSETVAGFGSSTSYSEAAVAAKTTIEFSVQPDLEDFGDGMTHEFQPFYGDDFRIQLEAHNYNDPELQMQMIDKTAAAFTAGVVSANEYRADLKKPPLPDPIADIPAVLLQPMLPEIGAPETGIPGSDGEDPYAAFAGSGEDLPTETDSGQSKPELAGKPTEKAWPRFTLNGLSAARFKSDDAGGRWITIGGEKGKDGKRHGGSPVFIKNGRITKGHPSLVGKKIGVLKEEAEHGTARQQLSQGRQYEIAKHRKAARQAGIDPKHLDQLAGEMKAHHDAFATERGGMLKRAREMSRNMGFGDISNLAQRSSHGHVDTDLKGFDVVAEQMANDYPHHFRAETAATGGDVKDQLFDMLIAGDPKPMSHGEAYEQALGHLMNEPRKPKEDYPADWDEIPKSFHLNGTH